MAARAPAGRRSPLTRGRVLAAAVELADAGGFEALSMRKLGQALGVEAMALYRHVRDKNELLDELAERLVAEMLPSSPAGISPDLAWKATLRSQVMAARRVMLRHPWGRDVLQARGVTGPVRLAYIDAVLGILRDGGFSVDLAHHALHVLDSRIFGVNLDFFSASATIASSAASSDVTDAITSGLMAERLPRLTEMAQVVSHDGALGACDDDVEFAFGLDLTLDGLERRLG